MCDDNENRPKFQLSQLSEFKPDNVLQRRSKFIEPTIKNYAPAQESRPMYCEKTSDIYFCACPYILVKSQAFWSEGSANSKTFSKTKDNYSKFKIEDCGNSKVGDGRYKDGQWQNFLL